MELEKAKRGRPLGTRIKGMPGYAPAVVTIAPRGRRPHQITVWRRAIPEHAEHGVERVKAEAGATAPRATTSPYLRFDSESNEWKLTDEAVRELVAYEVVGGDSGVVLRGLARQAVLTEAEGKKELPALSLKELEELGKSVICTVTSYPLSPELKEKHRQKRIERLERILGDRQELLKRAFTKMVVVDEAGRLVRYGPGARYIDAVTEKRYVKALRGASWSHFNRGRLYEVERVLTPKRQARGKAFIVPTEAGLELLAERFPSRVRKVKKELREKLEAYKAGRVVYMTPEMEWDAGALELKLKRQLERVKEGKPPRAEMW